MARSLKLRDGAARAVALLLSEKHAPCRERSFAEARVIGEAAPVRERRGWAGGGH